MSEKLEILYRVTCEEATYQIEADPDVDWEEGFKFGAIMKIESEPHLGKLYISPDAYERLGHIFLDIAEKIKNT